MRLPVNLPGSLPRLRRPGRPAPDPMRAVRRVLQEGAVRPLLHSRLQLDHGGREEFSALGGPVLIVANHASHLDTPLVLDALPAPWRRRTAVVVAGTPVLERAWRAAAAAVAFGTVLVGGPGPQTQRAAEKLLRADRSVLLFGEGARSADGFPGKFTTDAATTALRTGVAVIPVGIRGSYAAMPRGRSWPLGGTGWADRNRSRVSVRFGPALTAEPGESAEQLTDRISAAVRRLIAEDVTTWWQSQRDPQAVAGQEPPSGSWRRIWAQSRSPRAGNTVSRPKIWR